MHGVYAQYAWTPDGRSIVHLGAGHGSGAIDVAGGAGHADSVSRAGGADDLRAAALSRRRCTRRDSRCGCCATSMTSPDGTRVVYSALGHIYVEAAARRRAAAADRATPRSSSIRRSRPTGGRSCTRPGPSRRRPRPRRPGRRRRGARRRGDAGPLHRAVVLARRPQVVYRAVAGDLVPRPRVRGRDGAVRRRCGGGATPRLVREGGTDPQFDHTGTRLYFRERRDEKYVLASVELSGGGRAGALPLRERDADRALA